MTLMENDEDTIEFEIEIVESSSASSVSLNSLNLRAHSPEGRNINLLQPEDANRAGKRNRPRRNDDHGGGPESQGEGQSEIESEFKERRSASDGAQLTIMLRADTNSLQATNKDSCEEGNFAKIEINNDHNDECTLTISQACDEQPEAIVWSVVEPVEHTGGLQVKKDADDDTLVPLVESLVVSGTEAPKEHELPNDNSKKENPPATHNYNDDPPPIVAGSHLDTDATSAKEPVGEQVRQNEIPSMTHPTAATAISTFTAHHEAQRPVESGEQAINKEQLDDLTQQQAKILPTDKTDTASEPPQVSSHGDHHSLVEVRKSEIIKSENNQEVMAQTDLVEPLVLADVKEIAVSGKAKDARQVQVELSERQVAESTLSVVLTATPQPVEMVGRVIREQCTLMLERASQEKLEVQSSRETAEPKRISEPSQPPPPGGDKQMSHVKNNAVDICHTSDTAIRKVDIWIEHEDKEDKFEGEQLGQLCQAARLVPISSSASLTAVSVGDESASEDLEWEFDNEPTFESRQVEVKRNKDPREEYELGDELGRGKFGTVYRCVELASGMKLAAKFVHMRRSEDRIDVEREVAIMSRLQHKRLLQLYDAFDDGRSEMCLITELVEGGELFERIVDDDFELTEKKAAVFVRQICQGVDYMHNLKIVHLDMKPENILCVSKTGNRIKLIDFGLARELNPKEPLRVMLGTPDFAAPEVLAYDTVSFATDMWSVGVICYVLLSGLLPFMGDNDMDTMANVTRATYDFEDTAFEPISELAKDFIAKLLVREQAKRMKPNECLQHPWLQRGGAQLEASVRSRRESMAVIRTGAGGDSPLANQPLAGGLAGTDAVVATLDKRNLKKYVVRRKWHKTVHAIMALGRMGANLQIGLAS